MVKLEPLETLDKALAPVIISLFRAGTEDRSLVTNPHYMTDEAIALALMAPDSIWMAVKDETDYLVGLVGVQKISRIDGTCEIGVAVCEDSRRHGYGLEACKAFRKWLVETQNIRRIQSIVLEDSPVIGLAQKMGDTLEGILRKVRYKNGRYLDALVFGWLRDEAQQKEDV